MEGAKGWAEGLKIDTFVKELGLKFVLAGRRSEPVDGNTLNVLA